MVNTSDVDMSNELWKPPFMIDAGWVVTKPTQASEVVLALSEESRGLVILPAALREAIEQEDFRVIEKLQRGFAWPWRPGRIPDPQEAARVFRPTLGRVSAFRATGSDFEGELQAY